MKLPKKIEKFEDYIGEKTLTFFLWLLTRLSWKESKKIIKEQLQNTLK